MGPLSIITASPTPSAPVFHAGSTANSRDKANSEPRPTSLPTDQTLPVSEEVASQVARKTSETGASCLAGREQREDQLREAKDSALQLLTFNPSYHAVTYRIHPDLHGILQGNVIDHVTKEVLRQIPSDERIQLATAYRHNLGTTLDKLA